MHTISPQPWPPSFSVASVAQAQSLAELARKEEERRKKVPEADQGLHEQGLERRAGAPATPPPAASAAVPAADAAKDAASEKDAKDAKEKDASGKEIAKDQAYWAGRLKTLQDASSTAIRSTATRCRRASTR